MRWHTLSALLLLAVATPSRAQDAACTAYEATLAELTPAARAGTSGTWARLHSAYRRAPPRCDDGAYAEAASEVVGLLLTRGWRHVSELAALARRDASFGAYVLKHVDATLDDEVLAEIVAHARRQCPADVESKRCRELAAAAAQARAEASGN